MTKGGSIYIMTNKLKTTLYIGVSTNLQARIKQHKEHHFQNSFTEKYNLEYCVYYENYFSIEEVILKEKQKKMEQNKKENLINSLNPNWIDLWEEIKKWYLNFIYIALQNKIEDLERHVDDRRHLIKFILYKSQEISRTSK